jgi:hypothetical protein
MEDILLLGQVPGTSIHITFGVWLIAALIASLLAAFIYDKRRGHRLLFGAIYLSLRLQKRRMLKYFDQIAL